MHRRAFVRLLAAAASVKAAGLGLVAKAAGARSPLEPGLQIRSDLPPLKIVSKYSPAAAPGMPGPYPGRVVTVSSDKCVDIATSAANDEVVREMMAQGMRALTGAATTADAWRRFFAPTDVVGIKVNCGGYPNCISAYEIVAEIVRQLTGSASRSRRSTSTSGSRTRWTSELRRSPARRRADRGGRTRQSQHRQQRLRSRDLRRSRISSAKTTRGPT